MQNSKKGRKKIQVSLRNPYVISLLCKPITQHLLVQFLRNSNHAFPTHIHFYSQNFSKIRQLQPAQISPEQPKTPKKTQFFLIFHYRRLINSSFPCLINLKFIIHFYSQKFSKIRQLQPAQISPEQPKTPKKTQFFLIYHYRRLINSSFPCLINLKFIRHLFLILCRILIKNFSQIRSQQITQTLLQIPKRHFLSINSVLHNGIS